MITVSVEVRDGASARTLRVSAGSVSRALELCGADRPGREARVLFPIDPEGFFSRTGDAAVAEHGALPGARRAA